MNGSGLNFNTPGIVKVEKTFSVANNPNFQWTLIDNAFNEQNVIIELPVKGPALLPFCCFIAGAIIDYGVAGILDIRYFSNNAFAVSSIFSIPLVGNINTNAYNIYSIHNGNNFASGNEVWPAPVVYPSGIVISSDAAWNSGEWLTITLFCVNTGLNY